MPFAAGSSRRSPHESSAATMRNSAQRRKRALSVIALRADTTSGGFHVTTCARRRCRLAARHRNLRGGTGRTIAAVVFRGTQRHTQHRYARHVGRRRHPGGFKSAVGLSRVRRASQAERDRHSCAGIRDRDARQDQGRSYRVPAEWGRVRHVRRGHQHVGPYAECRAKRPGTRTRSADQRRRRTKGAPPPRRRA